MPINHSIPLLWETGYRTQCIHTVVSSPQIRPMMSRLLFLGFTLASFACGGGANVYQGMDPLSIYQIASEEYEAREYDNAIQALDRILLAYSDWEGALGARLLLGHAYYEKGDYLSAQSEYNRFLDRHASHEDAPIAALGVCRSLSALSPDLQRDQTYTNEAITICRNAVIDYAGTTQSVEAAGIANQMRMKLAEKEMRTGDFYFGRKLYDSAVLYYEFVISFYSDTEFAPWALMGLYQSNLAIGYDDLAEGAKERLLREYPESEAAAELGTDGSES